MTFPDRETLFRLGFRDLVGRLDALLVDPAGRGGFHDWLLLVERFPERLVAACQELTDDELRHCFDIAEAIFHGAQVHGGHRRSDLLYARFNLSAVLLRKMSPRPEFPFLDPDALLRDYLAALPMPLAEAVERARLVETLDNTEILRLRQPKELMNPLKMVDHLFTESPQLDEYRKWKGIWADLP